MNLLFVVIFVGSDETRSGYVRYVQGIQSNVPARNTFIDIYVTEGRLRNRGSCFALSYDAYSHG